MRSVGLYLVSARLVSPLNPVGTLSHTMDFYMTFLSNCMDVPDVEIETPEIS